MARYELSKPDFEMLDKALRLLAASYDLHGLGSWRDETNEFRLRFGNAHSAYLDEDGNG